MQRRICSFGVVFVWGRMFVPVFGVASCNDASVLLGSCSFEVACSFDVRSCNDTSSARVLGSRLAITHEHPPRRHHAACAPRAGPGLRPSARGIARGNGVASRSATGSRLAFTYPLTALRTRSFSTSPPPAAVSRLQFCGVASCNDASAARLLFRGRSFSGSRLAMTYPPPAFRTRPRHRWRYPPRPHPANTSSTARRGLGVALVFA